MLFTVSSTFTYQGLRSGSSVVVRSVVVASLVDCPGVVLCDPEEVEAVAASVVVGGSEGFADEFRRVVVSSFSLFL